MVIVVRVSQDRMEAIVEVERLDDETLDVEAVKRALVEARVTSGIDDSACSALVATANETTPNTRLNAAVARGSPAVAGEDGTVQMLVEYVRNTIGTPTDSGVIDFRDHGSFTPIAQGELIANIVLPTPGIAGADVYGTPIKPNPGSRARLTAGQGTKVEANGTELRATREGDLRCTGESIEVLDMIRVPGNLDFAIGNIDCEGPVRLEGDLLSGFHIRAGGDVWIGGVVESAEVTSAGTVTVAQGILDGGRICAKKGVKAGYVRDSYVESDNNIVILKEALNSTIVCGDTIAIPDSGRVVGGRLLAQNRIEVGVAGHEKGVPTILTAGVNPLKELRAANLAAEIHGAAGAQERIGKIKEIAHPDQHEILDQLLKRVASKHEGGVQELAELGDHKAALIDCRINIRKQVHPGVRIRIGTSDLKIEDEFSASTFRCDPETGQIMQVQDGRER